MNNRPPDWAMQLFCDRTGIDLYAIMNRPEYVVVRIAVREGARMIAKHEQPPVDPDVEAVKRIVCAWYGHEKTVFNPEKDFKLDRTALARAVAQYKQERAK